MANYKEDIVDIELTNGNTHRSFLNYSLGAGDKKANRFGIRAFRNGQPEELTGDCYGLFIRADNGTVTVETGTVSGNIAYVELPEACYAEDGPFTLAIKVESGNDTVTYRIVDGTVNKTSTNTPVDPGTVLPTIDELITAINAAVASIPADYSAMDKNTRELIQEIAGNVKFYSATSQSDWTQVPVVPAMAIKKDDYYKIDITFDQAPTDSTYILLNNGETQITNYQCKDYASRSVTYKATADMDNFNITVSSGSYTGKVGIKLTEATAQTAIEEHEISIKELSTEKKGLFSLQRLAHFVHGGYDYPDFNYNTHQISSRDIMTAPFDMYIRMKSGFRMKVLTIESGTATDSGWQTDSLYVPKGTAFVAKIERVDPDVTEVADIDEFLKQAMVFNEDRGTWYDIKKYADKIDVSKSIAYATGAVESAGSYYLMYSFRNPKFRFVKLFSSIYGRDRAEVAFYSSEEPSTSSYLGGANAGSWVQEHMIYAEVPAGCKLVCFVSRNILNDNTPHEIRIWADDCEKYTAENVLYKHDALSLFNGYKYVYHFNANRLGQAEIPLNSLMDIDVAHRLGFRAYEINARETATPGCYVCMHGNGGKIGTELVARDGTDISDIQINTVTKAEFEDDYVYNTPDDQLKTRVTFLEEALIRCRKYGMIPFISWPGYDGIDFIRKYVGNRFVLIIYDPYYLGRTAWKGAINLYKTLTDEVFEGIIKAADKPFVASLTSDEVEDMTDEEKLARIQLCHENNCIIGAAGVYQSEAENQKLFDLGIDYLASGWAVEDFGDGNIVNLNSNGTYEGFTHTGTVADGVLSLANGGTVSVTPDSEYLAKGCIKIRFSGTMVFRFGWYIWDASITSDGTKDVILSTAFFRQVPGFTATASGAVSIYEICYDASAC